MKRMFASALVASALTLAIAGPVHAQKTTDKDIATKTSTPAVAENAGNAGVKPSVSRDTTTSGQVGRASIAGNAGNAGDAYPAGPISRPDPRRTETRALPQTGDMDGDWRFSDKEAENAGNAGNAEIVLSPGNAGNAYPAGPISRHDPKKTETKTLPGHMPD